MEISVKRRVRISATLPDPSYRRKCLLLESAGAAVIGAWSSTNPPSRFSEAGCVRVPPPGVAWGGALPHTAGTAGPTEEDFLVPRPGLGTQMSGAGAEDHAIPPPCWPPTPENSQRPWGDRRLVCSPWVPRPAPISDWACVPPGNDDGAASIRRAVSHGGTGIARRRLRGACNHRRYAPACRTGGQELKTT